MKKWLKIVIVSITIITMNHVKAEAPTIEYIDNVYSNRISSEKIMTGQLGYIYIDGQIAFCIDPFKIIGDTYETNNNLWNELYTKEEQRKIQLIIHYGAGTHLNNPYYYMATQELIWSLKDDNQYYFTTTSSPDGEKIDIESYKNDIMNKVEKHDLLPSFAESVLMPKIYDQIELIDNNNVINHYEILNLSENKIIRKNNSINIQIIDNKKADFTLSYSARSGRLSNIYVGNGQTIITSNLDETKTTYIHINPSGISYYLKIKFLEDNRSIFGKVRFKIYNHNTSQYIEDGKIFESNNFGVFTSDFKLDLGVYEISYIDLPIGYIPSSMPNQFTLNEDTPINRDLQYELVSDLDVPKGTLTINRNVMKYDGSIQKLDGIEYKIYAASNIYDAHSKLLYNENELVDVIETKDGKAQAILPLGQYYVLEQENIYGIPISSEQNISFIYKDSVTEMYYKEITLTNNLPTLFLDIKTLKENIDGSYTNYNNYKYELYAKEDIKYLNEIVFYKGDFITTLSSDENGFISKNLNLIYGEYEIREVNEDSNYYEIESMVYSFTNENYNLNWLVEKKLKRGNLNIKIESEIDSIPNTISFVYDKKYIYDIQNDLLINDIKIGEYKVIYDKEYSVIIYPNETTTLVIKIKKVEEENKEEIEEDKKENPEEDKDSDNKKDEETNDSKEDINNDLTEDNVGKEEIEEDKKDSPEEEKNSDNKKDEETNDPKEDINNDTIENNNSNKDDISQKTEDIYNQNNDDLDKTEELPETFNYFKKYYYLFYLYFLIGLSLKIYEKKN